MNQPTILELIDLIEELLDSHPERYKTRGLNYHQQGRVNLESINDLGSEFKFLVQGSEIYHVQIAREIGDSIHIHCDCPVEEMLCKHTAAASLELLIQLESGSIKAIQTGERQPKDQQSSSETTPEESELAVQLRAATKKNLTSEQKGYISKVFNFFKRAPAAGSVAGNEINCFFSGQRFIYWERFQLWHSRPKNDYELWLYLVYFAQKNRLLTPSFMDPLLNLEPIQEKLEAWDRAIQIDNWSNLFNTSATSIGIPAIIPQAPQDQELRLHFDRQGASLSWREGPDSEFIAIPGPILKTLNGRLHSGSHLDLEERSELLFRRLAGGESGRAKKKLSYNEYETTPILRSLLQSNGLGKLLMTPAGKPFERTTSPLRLQLSPPPKDASNNYGIRFVDHKNTPIKGLIHIVRGTPSWALTESSIHPVASLPGVDISQFLENATIPAEAVESEQGIQFLDRMGAELPKTLKQRIRRIPLRLHLICELKSAYREECHILVTSTLPNEEHFAYWNGDEWIRHPGVELPSSESPNQVTIMDDQALADATTIFDRVNVSFDPYQQAHKLAVTKKFPDVFSEWLASLPKGTEVELRGELAAFEDQDVVGRLKLEVEEAEQDWFDLKVVLDVNDTDLTQDEINLLLKAHGKWVRIKDKGWRRLSYELDEVEDLDFARLGINPRELTDEPQRFHALQLATPAAKQLLPTDQAEAVQRRINDIKTRVTPPKPRSIKADLRPYQLEGFHFLAYLTTNHFGGILADDMGLGKTLQTLTWLAWLRRQQKGKSKPSLVVCPKSVMDNWSAEGDKFAPGITIKVWTASQLADFPENLTKADVHVINYNQLRSIGDAIRSKKFLAVILDEGQYIKNPSSQTTKTAYALKAEHRLVLTGTPIENRALDLWSLMSFAMPGVLGNRTRFGKLYDSKTDPLARLRLSSRVRPFLIRRTKNQVAQDLPERIEDEIHCELEGTQKKLYEAELKHAQQTLLKAKNQRQLNQIRFNFLTSLLRLRQICAHPALFHKPSRAKSSKIEALLELLEPLMEEGAKVLIFSQFVSLIQILEKDLTKNGIKTWKLTGDTEDRGALVKDFQNTPEPGAFLISLKAGGSGLNLTAATYVVIFDPWWNPAVEAQAIDRTHRIGQTSKIIAYRLIMKNTIEEKIRKLQAEKQALVKDVLGEEQFSQALTLKDFQFLFQD